MKETIKDSMSFGVVSIDRDDEMSTAYNKMHENRIRHLPVTDSSGNIVGILSDRDVNRAMLCNSTDAQFELGAKVRNYMSWPVKTYDKNRKLKDVAKEMIKDKISCLLVSDAQNNIVGIITTDDLLRVLIELLDEPRPVRAWNLEDLIKTSFKQVMA